MRGTVSSFCVSLVMLSIILFVAWPGLALNLTDHSFAMASRISAVATGFPLTSGSGRLDVALGFEGVSIGAFAQQTVSPLPYVVLGGRVDLLREWLTLSISMDSDPMLGGVDASIRGQASHPGWPLLEGPLTIHAGWDASAGVEGQLGDHRTTQTVTMSPSVAAIAATRVGTVIAKLGAGVQCTRTDALMTSNVVVSLLLPRATISLGAEMTGGIDEVVALRGGVEIPAMGVVAELLTVPQAADWLWELRVSITFGDSALLPDSGAGDDACIGGTCYGP